jgi:putative aldouronate transport system permease protein
MATVPRMETSSNALLSRRKRYWLSVFKNWQLYVFIAPALIYIIIFSYVPMYGIMLAFKDFSMRAGITHSPWADPIFKNFKVFLEGRMFRDVLLNTVSLSLYGMIAGFPLPILLALMLNELKNKRFMKIVQNVTYAPHFISMVVIVGMIKLFFTSSGIINQLLNTINLPPVAFLNQASYFPHIYVWSGVWQGIGYSSIIYFASLASVPPELHEAAVIDGASRFKRIWHINLPHIRGTIVILLILSTANIMSVGFEKIYLMQSSLNLAKSEVISTYIYKVGVTQRNFSLGTAVGLFNNVINLALMMLVNWIASKIGDTSLF